MANRAKSGGCLELHDLFTDADLYELSGVAEGASPDEVKEAYIYIYIGKGSSPKEEPKKHTHCKSLEYSCRAPLH